VRERYKRKREEKRERNQALQAIKWCGSHGGMDREKGIAPKLGSVGRKKKHRSGLSN